MQTLFAGEGVRDITPPVGIELAGFHKRKGPDRNVTGVRSKASVRALVLRMNHTRYVLLSVDMLGVSADFAQRVQRGVERRCGIPASQVRVCATHTHSMPTFRYLRQWGTISPTYMATVEARCVEAVQIAIEDLAESDCYVGRENVIGGNSNRTVKTWKTTPDWTADATDAERWLDTTVHAIYFQRAEGKKSIVWYHFSAHPVCYQDGLAGPDWPALVAEYMRQADGIEPGYLQGHIGDVNPGDGTKWIGDPEPTAIAIATALRHATQHSELVMPEDLVAVQQVIELPHDLGRLQQELTFFREHPEECVKDTWVDAEFAKDWYAEVSAWAAPPSVYRATVSAMRLGGLAMLFHPAELYSFYGLQLRATSPFAATLCVGFADDLVGYVTDPKAYEANEYSAIVVPKITGLPPFTPETGRVMTAACQGLLARL